MFAAESTIYSRFNKKQLIIILNEFNLPNSGTKKDMVKRIFDLKKSCEELRDIIEIDTYGYIRCKTDNKQELLCCVCLRKGFEIDMYSCKSCKEGIVCPACMDNLNYELYDENFNNLCPICKTFKLNSNYIKQCLKEKCNLIKEISETKGILLTDLLNIINKVKKEIPGDSFENDCLMRTQLCNELNIEYNQAFILLNY